jgi:hypothetical protein
MSAAPWVQQVERWAAEVDHAARHMSVRHAVSVLVGINSLWGPWAERITSEAFLAGMWQRVGVSAGQGRAL